MDLPIPERPSPRAPEPGEPPSLVELVRRGALDAELAALVWVLVEGDIPLVVAAGPEVDAAERNAIAAGILASVRPELTIDEATALATPLTTRAARTLVHGERRAGTVTAGSLQGVHSALGGAPIGLGDDELTFLGCVLVLAPDAPAPVAAADPSMNPRPTIRVVAAHYVRPLARDEHGHAQLLPPAVLATWDPTGHAFEHFAWGALAEIAIRLGRRLGDLEADLHHRRDDLGGLAAAGVTALDEVRQLVAGYRVRYGHAHGGDHARPRDAARGGAHGHAHD